ncbi:MAG TPA: radical SAM protein [Sediminispirochaeta sp.]|nr:radical SAM protein [Sediminispirochaeta sp.]
MKDEYRRCLLCPRRCGVDRSAGELGFCRQDDRIRLACATRHFGEEPPLTEGGGSGTLFFSGCTLRCGFCQNVQLSRSEVGAIVDENDLAEIFLEMEARGARNLNFVSATPFLPGIEGALEKARHQGLSLPVVWNGSGYETVETVRRLAGFVDIFLPDLKLLDPPRSGRLFAARDYPRVAVAAIRVMVDAAPLRWEEGELKGGTIVRHLVLPGLIEESLRVLEWCAENLRDRALLSLMLQFSVPPESRGRSGRKAGLEYRQVRSDEYDRLLRQLDDLGIEEGFIQEADDEEEWWPNFEDPNPFPAQYSKVVWSCNVPGGFTEGR